MMAAAWFFRKLGGPFTHEPGDLYDEKTKKFHGSLSLGAQELIQKAFTGTGENDRVDASRMVDYHTHIVGQQKEETGCTLDRSMLSWRSPWQYVKARVFMAASGVLSVTDSPDRHFVDRLKALIRHSAPGQVDAERAPVHGKHCTLALCKVHNNEGEVCEDKTSVYVPNKYIHQLAKENPQEFISTCSIHPADPKALEKLDECHGKGAKLIKWLPNAMNIDPGLESYRAFYEKVRKLNMFLLVHTGDEHSISSGFHDNSLGNPLKLRLPLSLGVKVIAAHCGSEGYSKDETGLKVHNFDLFLKLMNEEQYRGLLFGDLSALTSFRRVKYLKELLSKTELHDRLVNGSDYPVCAISVIIRTGRLVSFGLITPQQRHFLNEIYYFNPILFDFVIKRTIKTDGMGFPARIFMEHPKLKVLPE